MTEEYLPAEQRARVQIDRQLARAGWTVVDGKDLNLFAGPGVAVRERVMKSGHGRVDYLLYVDTRVVGVVEAKPEGTPLSGVEWQSAMYATGLPERHAKRAHVHAGRLPFAFEASGSETKFTNGYDPEPRSRRIFSFPRPDSLARLIRDASADPERPTWRAKVRALPDLATTPLRSAQIEALNGIERSLAGGHHGRSLVQMATGAGKTFAAVTQCYRLLKYGGFQRVLFLVDRNNLGTQALGEFHGFVTPDDGRKFTELYPVVKLGAGGVLASSQVVISTIQRVHGVLRGREIVDSDDPELDSYDVAVPVDVDYCAELPPEFFDLVIVDECHRSIYGNWRAVVEYFDAHVIGLTATPVRQTFGFFGQNLVSAYTYAQAVADGVNVDFDVYRIRTEISERGGLLDAGSVVPKLDVRTRRERYEALDDDLDYTPGELDHLVTSRGQIRLVLETFKDRLFTEIFPGRTVVPKTLIFCKNDNHAEEVVTAVREVFGKGNDFAAKITYSAHRPDQLIKAFSNSPTLRIAVTVDLIATGTDVKPLECVFFMRDVRTASYFEQMKGRGARTLGDDDFQAVTPDAQSKTRFVLVDAVGVTEHPYVQASPLNRVRAATLVQLLDRAATLTATEDEVATLASRLARLDLLLSWAEQSELAALAGCAIAEIVRGLVAAIDPDRQAEAIEAAGPGANVVAVRDALLHEALRPLAANPDLRARLVEIRRSRDIVIDESSADVLIDAKGVPDAQKARQIVDCWRKFMAEHRDEIVALQILYSKPRGRVTYADLSALADRIARPPHNWTPDLLWRAYETLDAAKVHRSDRHTATDLIRLIAYELDYDAELVPYREVVESRYTNWLARQAQAGVEFTADQRWWLDAIRDAIVQSAGFETAALDREPFTRRGGVDGALAAFGDDIADIVEDLDRELTA
ncbi:MAG: type I restriction endonuclease subunit R [Sporichthyaceae bacterium]